LGSIDVSFYRDDYGSRSLQAGIKKSSIPFAVEGAHVVIVDDVLYTGRTIRAAINELFDYGRPGRIELAVLADRGGRELPIAADYCAHTLSLAPSQTLVLERADDGRLGLRITEK
jgi:pyrimidine operon attenuation protein/uracil phosphoribosyltransferase